MLMALQQQRPATADSLYSSGQRNRALDDVVTI